MHVNATNGSQKSLRPAGARQNLFFSFLKTTCSPTGNIRINKTGCEKPSFSCWNIFILTYMCDHACHPAKVKLYRLRACWGTKLEAGLFCIILFESWMGKWIIPVLPVPRSSFSGGLPVSPYGAPMSSRWTYNNNQHHIQQHGLERDTVSFLHTNSASRSPWKPL